MSEASAKGKKLELEVARLLRSKLGAKVARDKRSGAGINKADVTNYYQDIPLHLEMKNHKTIKIREWFDQAKATAPAMHVPTVVFRDDNEVLACLRFSDLVNLLVEIQDNQAAIQDLRSPTSFDESGTCRNGHLTQGLDFCLQKGCKYSRGYRPPKGKK